MKLYTFFDYKSFVNTYLLGPDNGGEAILIDPAVISQDIIDIIEESDYCITSVLVTHNHDKHVAGLQTLRKIYKADIYAGSPRVMDFDAELLHEGIHYSISNFDVKAYSVQGHSQDSLVYSIENLLFTGDVLFAGSIGETLTPYSQAILMDNIRTKLYELPPETIVLPGHGPPTSIGAETRYNPELKADPFKSGV